MTTEHELHTSWQLAHLAETASPDAHDGRGFSADQDQTPEEGSPGAQFLRSVESSTFELAGELAETVDEDRSGSYAERADYDGRLHELADSAVPIYTHERWATFVDLAAYSEDVDELAGGETDMETLAGIALYMVAERLARALLEELETAAADVDEDEEDDTDD